MKKLVWPFTLVMVLATLIGTFNQVSNILLFILSCLAIIPLAGIMGRATESIAAHAGPRIGGLLSATFGNAVELIIGIIALKNGMITIVKASITGSIIGNLLFVLGLSFLVGGVRHPIQQFNIRAARSNASMLLLSVGVAFIVPAIFSTSESTVSLGLSAVVAVVSFLLYISGLYFALFTHRDLFESIDETAREDGETHVPSGSLLKPILVLLAATLLVGYESDVLVESIKVVGHTFGWSEVFMGVIVVAVIGNAAEHASAVWMAWKNRMDLSLEIAVGSSLQVAMFVAPVLFGVSLLFGHAMPLLFSWPELASMGAAVVLVVVLMMDGESNWLEGAMAVGAYLVMAVGFFTLQTF